MPTTIPKSCKSTTTLPINPCIINFPLGSNYQQINQKVAQQQTQHHYSSSKITFNKQEQVLN